jgi:hypothetical protein
MQIFQAFVFCTLLFETHSFHSSRAMSSTLRSLATTSLFVGRGISVSEILKNPQWPEKWPFTPKDFSRQVTQLFCLEFLLLWFTGGALQ